MSAESFIKEVHKRHTKDRGHNVTTRYMEVAEELGAALKQQERKTSDLFLKMSVDIDEGLGKLEVLRATLARLVTAADGMHATLQQFIDDGYIQPVESVIAYARAKQEAGV